MKTHFCSYNVLQYVNRPFSTFRKVAGRVGRCLCADYRPPRHCQDYATHLPVLIALSSIIPIRRVLEFGSGTISTVGFLNRDAFPYLENIDSFEDDPLWAQNVVQAAQEDSRLQIKTVSPPISATASVVPYNGYDLIFIDDSTRWQDRVKTIGEVARRSEANSVIVVHDFEFPAYREAASTWSHLFEFRAFNPSTGVLWERAELNRSNLRQLARAIARHTRTCAPGDLNGWVRVLRNSRRA